jgi:hypothetical protein
MLINKQSRPRPYSNSDGRFQFKTENLFRVNHDYTTVQLQALPGISGKSNIDQLVIYFKMCSLVSQYTLTQTQQLNSLILDIPWAKSFIYFGISPNSQYHHSCHCDNPVNPTDHFQIADLRTGNHFKLVSRSDSYFNTLSVEYLLR